MQMRTILVKEDHMALDPNLQGDMYDDMFMCDGCQEEIAEDMIWLCQEGTTLTLNTPLPVSSTHPNLALCQP